MKSNLAQRTVAEGLGAALLLAAVIGSGIMGERLAGGNVAIALLANTIATGAVLVTLILTFAPISGAHFNPAVTLCALSQRELNWREALAYMVAQLMGAGAGALTANVMFGEPLVSFSRHARNGSRQFFSEVIAAFGLIVVIRACAKYQPRMVAFAVGGYITAAYWFTASTSFANPAVTIARSLSDTFAGIRPMDVPLFVVAQLIGASAAILLTIWLLGDYSPRDRHD
ncbi:MAG TPA: MIP/aquaporin family protein [Pyrinomonadaceae bacterium]